jgi:hypothetical protein
MGLLSVFKFFFERTVTTSTGDLPVKDQKTSAGTVQAAVALTAMS